MIPAHGWAVTFKLQRSEQEKPSWHSEPIIAWDDEGEPWIACEGDQRLTHPKSISSWNGFPVTGWRIQESSHESFDSAVAGGGWMVTWSDEQGKTVSPIVAWVIDRTGWGFPVVVDDTGALEPLSSGDHRVWHPAQED